MSSPTTAGSLPDSLMPAAFMVSEEAYNTVVGNYAAIGSLAILMRDILDNIVSDYHICKSGLNVPLCAYFASRIGAVGYLLGSVIFSSVPIGHCGMLNNILSSLSSVAFLCTALLFFIRLRAVYNQNRVVVAIFFMLWLAFLASSIAIPFSIKGAKVGSTRYCAIAHPDSLSLSWQIIVIQLTPLVYDTLVFLAISWRLCRISCIKPPGPQGSLKLLVFGKYLPAFTKSLYLDGQAYYLSSLIAGIVVSSLVFIKQVPAPLKLLLWFPYVALVNITACRVYRRTRMGVIRESEISTSAISRAVPVGPLMFNNDNGNSLTTIGINDATAPHMNFHHHATPPGTMSERRSLV